MLWYGSGIPSERSKLPHKLLITNHTPPLRGAAYGTM
jgi:hypothetical protein